MASEYAGITPYQYAFNNPVMFNDPSGLSPNKSGQEMIDWAMGQLDGYNRTQYNGSVAGTADSDRWGHSFGGAFVQERDNDFALSQSGGGDPPWWKQLLNFIGIGSHDRTQQNFETREDAGNHYNTLLDQQNNFRNFATKINKVRKAYSKFSRVGHTMLDVGGMAPIIGEPLDFINGVWYSLEGDPLNSGLSFAATLPFLGWSATSTKYVHKVGKRSYEVTKYTSSQGARFTQEIHDVPVGELFGSVIFKSNGDQVGILAEKELLDGGKTLRLYDIAFYGTNAQGKALTGQALGVRELLLHRSHVASWAKEMGYSKIIFEGERVIGSSSANPGMNLKWVIDLTAQNWK